MAYEVETQDGIVIRGIPDNIPPDHETIRAKVVKARADRDSATVTADMTPGQRFLAGIGMGMSRVGRGMGQITGLVPQSTVDEAAPRDAALSNTGAGMAGEVVGNLALTAVPGMGVGGLAAKGAGAVLPALVATTVGAAATGGAISAATTPVPTGDTRIREAAIGAAGGAIGDVAARTAARVAQPIMQSDAVKRLLNEGIVPTPGQAGGGAWSKLEEKATSVPLTGEIIEHGRVRPRTEFNRAELNKAMPAGSKVSQVGNAGFQEVKQELSGAYDRILAGHVVQPDEALAIAVNNAKQVPLLPLTEQRQKQFDAVLDKILWQRVPYKNVSTGGAPGTSAVPAGTIAPNASQMGGSVAAMPAERMKSEVIGDLGKIARQHLSSTTAEEKAFGEALMAARDAVNGWTISKVAAVDPSAAAKITMLDKHYSVRKQLEKAVDRSAAQGGVFTPYQAIRATLPGTEARELAETAQSVIGNRVPNSGTTDRGLLAYLMMHPSSVVNPAEYVGIPLASLAYSRPGSRYMLGDLIPGQQTLAEMARRAAPATAQGGRALNESWQNRSK